MPVSRDSVMWEVAGHGGIGTGGQLPTSSCVDQYYMCFLRLHSIALSPAMHPQHQLLGNAQKHAPEALSAWTER